MDKENTYPAWHFNFRDKSKLPDVKSIRRSSQLNIISVVVAALALAWVGYVEYETFSWRMRKNTLEEQVTAAKPANEQLLKLDQEFIASKYIVSAANSVRNPSVDFIKALSIISEKRPKNLVFNTISIREDFDEKGFPETRKYQVELNGFVKGKDDNGLDTMESFEKTLSEDSFFSEIMKKFNVEALERAEEVGMLNFAINLELEASLQHDR